MYVYVYEEPYACTCIYVYTIHTHLYHLHTPHAHTRTHTHSHTHAHTLTLTHTHTHTHSYSFNADIWGLGILAYECCAGRGPYQSKGTFELLDAIVDGDAPVYTLKRVYAYTRIRINAHTYACVYA